MKEFKLPDPGEGLLEAEIVHWNVAVGDVVKVNDILLEVETAKSLVELPSPHAGVVAALLVAEGDEVAVGTPIILIAESVEEAAAWAGGTSAAPSGPAPAAGERLSPASPAAWPVAPAVSPVAPASPVVAPASSAVAPVSPVASPASPAVAPVSPVVTPVSPVASPASPASPGASPAPVDSAATVTASPSSSTASPGPPAEPLAARPAESAASVEPAPPVLEGTVEDPAPAEPRPATLVGYGAKTGSVSRRPRKATAVVPGPQGDQVHESYDTAHPVSRRVDEVTPSTRLAAQPSGDELPPPGRPAHRRPSARPPLAKPPVRRIARDLGVDLNAVVGTGSGGVITAEDVIAAAGAQGRVGAGPTGDQRIPLRGIRREMFRSMTASLQVPQATAWVDVDVTNTMTLLETLKTRREFANLRLSPLLIFAKAACLAIARNPEINSSLDLDAEEIVLHGDVNLGIAAATPRGLVVPNIKKANQMSLLELAQALNDMVAVAKQGKVQPYDLSLGTFTITNIGIFGIDAGTPIMNPGEAAIMCLGTIVRRPWVVGSGEDEKIVPRSVCTVALTFDHRLVDGEHGSKFLADVATIMQDPGLSLLF